MRLPVWPFHICWATNPISYVECWPYWLGVTDYGQGCLEGTTLQKTIQKDTELEWSGLVQLIYCIVQPHDIFLSLCRVIWMDSNC